MSTEFALKLQYVQALLSKNVFKAKVIHNLITMCLYVSLKKIKLLLRHLR